MGKIMPSSIRSISRKTSRKKKPLGWGSIIGLLALLLAAGSPYLLSEAQLNRAIELIALLADPEAKSIDRQTTSALPRGNTVQRQFAICSGPHRVNCVVDGDTLWIDGDKIRIADINTPEVTSPQCRDEAVLGARATKRLQQLVNAGPFELRRIDRDVDHYGRALRTLHRDGRSLGEIMVADGLAHRWGGRRGSWCG